MKLRIINPLFPFADRKIGDIIDQDWGVADALIRRGVAELCEGQIPPPGADLPPGLLLRDNKMVKPDRVKRKVS